MNDCELPSDTVLAVGLRLENASTSAVVVASSVITSPCTTSAPGRGVCRYSSSTRARNLIVPRVPGPEGSGLGGVEGEPVPVLGMPAPISFPPVVRPRVCSSAETSKATFVEPFACTADEKFAPAKGCDVNVCDFCVNVSVGVNVASNSWPSERMSATLKSSSAKKSLTWKLSVYSIRSPARGEPGFVRSAYVFCRATVRAVSVCWALGSSGSLAIDCGPG